MKSAIIKGLNEQEADEIRQAFAHAFFLRKQVISLLQDKIAASNRTSRSKDAYGIANWAYLQADAVGYERGMQEVISLLTHESEAVAVPQGTATTLPAKKRGRPKVVKTSE